MATIIISWLFLVVVVVVGIQYMKANPEKNKSSYIVEGLLIGFFTGALFSMAFLDWNWLGASNRYRTIFRYCDWRANSQKRSETIA